MVSTAPSSSAANDGQPSGSGPRDRSAGGPLAGIVVLDLTRVLAGPYSTMVLSDLGARVVKVEPPGGDEARNFGPWVDETSVYFASLNRGKESIVLDLKEPADRDDFDALLARADVLVENFRPGTLERLGYGWSDLHESRPGLIVASCSGFGQTGPWARRPAYDMIVQGMGGLMSLTGHPGGPPTRVGTSIGDITAGLFLTIGIQAALVERIRTGKGQHIDVSMLDCQIAILENAVAKYFATGIVPPPSEARHPAIAPFGAFRCADGHVMLAAGNDRLFARLCEVLGTPELVTDSRFATNRDRAAHAGLLESTLEARLEKAPCAHWLQHLEAAGIPAGPLNTVADAVRLPPVRARNMIVDIDALASVRIPGNPVKLSGHADPETRGQVPGLDGNREEILAWAREKDSGENRESGLR